MAWDKSQRRTNRGWSVWSLVALLMCCWCTWDADAQSGRRSRRKVTKTRKKSGRKKAPIKADVLDFGFDDVDPAEEKRAREELSNISLDLGGEFDFGDVDLNDADGFFDFGSEDVQITSELAPEDKQQFELGKALMNSGRYAEAAVIFERFAAQEMFGEFQQEAEYQLAKALYKLDMPSVALKRFQVILRKGTGHRRFQKSIEWLFFVARRISDQTPVLAELARFRNIRFPRAYRDEYNFLLAKYFFVQAQRFEVARLAQEEFDRTNKEAGNIDWEDSTTFDFDESSNDFDFGSDDSSFDFGEGGASFDFGTEEKPKESVEAALPETTQQAVDQAIALVKEISSESIFGAKARYLEGLLSYLNGEDQAAVDAFRDVVATLNPRKTSRPDPTLRETAFLSLARIHYEHEQFSYAAYYYDQLDRDSEHWLTALVESSWAYYRRGDHEKALGSLVTLNAPFFAEEYYPEVNLIQSIIYYEACRYKESRVVLDQFVAEFQSVLKRLQTLLREKKDATAFFAKIRSLRATLSSEDRVMAKVLNLAERDEEIKKIRASVEEADAQVKALQLQSADFRESDLGKLVWQALRRMRADRLELAGLITSRRLEAEVSNLKSLLAQALRIKLEVVRAERRVLERLNANIAPPAIVAPRIERVVDDESLYWPHEGEFWRDELGTYEIDFAVCEAIEGGV